jgi:hypothetical protein
VNTIFVPYSPGTVADLHSQIQSGLLGVDAIQKSTTKDDYVKAKEKEHTYQEEADEEHAREREQQQQIEDFDFDE